MEREREGWGEEKEIRRTGEKKVKGKRDETKKFRKENQNEGAKGNKNEGKRRGGEGCMWAVSSTG